MNENNYSGMLRTLSKEYYQGHISFDEYREKRKSILDEIDAEYNGWQELPELDVQEEKDSSFLNKALGLFKSGDTED